MLNSNLQEVTVHAVLWLLRELPSLPQGNVESQSREMQAKAPLFIVSYLEEMTGSASHTEETAA